ncbi:MAG: hypothetical protein D6790_21695, partial [Caldilineae bacterium]
MTRRLELPDGGHVIIIGGGPAGCACALALHRLAYAWGRRVRITVIEGKRFDGAYHYNQCAGVLSPPLPELLEDRLGLPFPYHLSRGEITGYVLHTTGEEILLDGDAQPSIALRRVQFDAYMLEAVRARGVHVVSARASDLEIHPDRVVVYTENDSLSGDVVVGAFGLDEGTGSLFARQTGYRPPQALSSVVTKYHPGPAGMAAFGPYIHAFLPPHPRIEFGAVTPKGNHLTINIAGKAVDVNAMQDFLAMPAVQAVLPNLAQAGAYDERDLRFYKGRFPCSLARRFYGDRYVMVGDAAGLVRAFKGKGVTSGVLTGIRAAEAILTAGIHAGAFHNHYRSANRDIIGDLPYGRGMRLATMLLARWGLLAPVVRAAAANRDLQQALFDAVSAHAPYREVLARTLHP